MEITGKNEVQMRRMAGASEEALAHRRRLYMAYVVQSAPEKINKLQQEVDLADQRFELLINTRGLCKSDRVRVTADGELHGSLGEIEEVESGGDLTVRFPDGEVWVMLGVDLELVEHAPQAKRHRASRKERS